MKLTITKKIGILLLIPACGALITIGIFYWFLAQTVTDAPTINTAGRQRMFSEQLLFNVHMVNMGQEEAREGIKEIVRAFDRSLVALEYGGEVMGRNLAPAPPNIMREITMIKRLWNDHKKILLLIADAAITDQGFQEAYDFVQHATPLITQASDRIVAAYEKEFDILQNKMFYTLIAIATFDMFLLILGLLVIRRYVAERRHAEQALITEASYKDLRRVIEMVANEATTAEEAIQITLDQICTHTGWPVGHAYVVAKGHVDELVSTAIWHLETPEQFEAFRKTTEIVRFVSGAGLPGRVLASGKPAWIRDITDDPGFARTKLVQDIHIKLKAGFAFPFMIRDEVVAVLEFYSSQVEEPDDQLLRFAHHIGSQLGRTIERKRTEVERMINEEHLRYLAHYDNLTGLPNRTLFLDRLRQTLRRNSRHKCLEAVLILGLDRFKVVNDTLGHDKGDRLLQAVSERLTGFIRESDTVGRLSGDEFGIILVDIADEHDIIKLAQKILNIFSNSFFVEEKEFYITVSIGISNYPNDSNDALNLLKYADIAMHRAKEEGKNHYQLYSPVMNAKALEAFAMESKLRQALERDEFLIHYQPKIDLHTGEVVGMEGLLRWQHPELGLVSPGEFIPILEEIGLIVPVGEWVIRTACAQNKAWQDMGLPRLRVAVNLSSRQFKKQGLVEIVKKALDDTGLDISCLELELTESVLMEHTEESIRVLNELHLMGIHLTIDDFGTGYSSLSYLKRFPINSLKIDRSFVQDVTSDPDDAAIARATIAMAHSLRLNVVAEGVETKAQLAFLLRYECDEMQGYYFNPPLPVERFTDLLKESRCLDMSEFHKQEGGHTILVVDDEEPVRLALTSLMQREGYNILSAKSAEEALELLPCYVVDVVLSDQRMPEMTGVEFLKRVKELYPNILRIMLTGGGDIESMREAINEAGVYKFVTKPVDFEELRIIIKNAFNRHDMDHEHVNITVQKDQGVGNQA